MEPQATRWRALSHALRYLWWAKASTGATRIYGGFLFLLDAELSLQSESVKALVFRRNKFNLIFSVFRAMEMA